MIRHFLNPPNWFTSAGIFCGLYSIVLSTGVEGPPNYYHAAMMVLFASVFDMLDGRVARITGRGSDFGIQLDSLADVVSFGIAPAVLLHSWGIHSLGAWGLIGSTSLDAWSSAERSDWPDSTATREPTSRPLTRKV